MNNMRIFYGGDGKPKPERRLNEGNVMLNFWDIHNGDKTALKRMDKILAAKKEELRINKRRLWTPAVDRKLRVIRRYFVSSWGDVKGPKGILKLSTTADGYLKVDVRCRTWRVHILVALAWIDNPEKKEFVNHIARHYDGADKPPRSDKTNNRVENLEWATAVENALHATRIVGTGAGENNSRSKLTNAEVREIRASKEPTRRLMKKYGVSRTCIDDIRSRRSWKCLGEKICKSIEKNS